MSLAEYVEPGVSHPIGFYLQLSAISRIVKRTEGLRNQRVLELVVDVINIGSVC